MRIAYLPVLLLALPLAARAQGVPGTRIQLDVEVVAASVSGDTTTISYRLANRASSAEQLYAFTVDVPSGTLDISHPQPHDDWMTLTVYRRVRPVAQWTVLGDEVQPAQSSPVLTFRARGLPGLVNAWVRGYAPPPPLPAPVDTLPDPPPIDPLVTRSVSQLVVGVEPMPADVTPAALLARLRAFLGRACGDLGWIDSTGVCNSLDKKLAAADAALARGQAQTARLQLSAFSAELDAQLAPPAGKKLDSRAFALLAANAAFLQGRL